MAAFVIASGCNVVNIFFSGLKSMRYILPSVYSLNFWQGLIRKK